MAPFDRTPPRRPTTRAHGLPRRSFLGAAATAALSPAALAARSARRTDRARNVIFMVADGMSVGTLQMADQIYRQSVARPSHWVALWDRPDVRRAAQMTHSANALVTDSAAAGSAWGVGEHVNNRAVNVTPDGREPTPILVEARRRGKATGLVTTTRVTHATPASFVANAPSRDMEDAIAEQILDRGVDVVLGGGARHFPESLLEQHPARRVVRTVAELRAYVDTGSGDPRPVLGLFNDDHMRYEIDRRAQPADREEPSLAGLTRVALTELFRAPDGFALQIEGGRVDHAAHANDVAALLHDQYAFDEAIGVALSFVEDRDDTLVIITTDHANANPGHTLYGEAGNRAFDAIAKATRSFDWIFERLARAGASRDPDAVADALQRASGVELDPRERDVIQRTFGERGLSDPFRPASAPGPVLGSILANHFGVAFVSPNHTADYVELTAFGPGSGDISGLMDNVELHGVMRRALGFA